MTEIINTKYTSDFFERAARSLLGRSAEYLTAAHSQEHMPIYRDTCLRLAYSTSQDATRAFAVARDYRLREQ